MKTSCVRRPSAGFTLIELMITVAVIAVLAAVAYPSYTDYIRKSRRAMAQGALMEIASKEQAFLIDRRRYAGDIGALGYTAPGELANNYTLSVVCVPADCSGTPAFTATATPSSTLVAKGEKTMTINQAGAKTPANTLGYWGN